MNLKRLSTLLVPGIILQSVLIGGGFATGREIVEYGGKFGPLGWITGLSIFLGFTIMAILTFEVCRVRKVYDYKSLLKELIGSAWWIYEIIYLSLAILIIAVMASAAGEILKDIFNLNYWVGVIIVIVAVGYISLKGEAFLIKMKTIGTIALFSAYTLFGISVVINRSNEIVSITRNFSGSTSFSLLLFTGIIYVGYNLGVYPSTLFTIKRISSQSDSIIAGIISGILMTIPWFLTWVALLGYFPSPEIFNAPVPWLEMLKSFNPVYIIVFGVVVGWTLIETATGIIHAFISRLDLDLRSKHQFGLSPEKKAGISVTVLLVAVLLSQIGIIDLIAKGYTWMSYGMILVFALPLLIKGSFIAISNR